MAKLTALTNNGIIEVYEVKSETIGGDGGLWFITSTLPNSPYFFAIRHGTRVYFNRSRYNEIRSSCRCVGIFVPRDAIKD